MREMLTADYIRSGQAGNLTPAMQAVMKSVPGSQVRTGVSVGIGGAGVYAPLPAQVQGTGMVRYGTQLMSHVPSYTNTAPSYSGMYNLERAKGTLADALQGNVGTNLGRLGFSARRPIQAWAAINLTDLNATGGGINAGMIGVHGRRGLVHLGDDGLLGKTVSEAKEDFLGAFYGRPDELGTRFNTYREAYVRGLGGALAKAGTNITGIKDVGMEVVEFQGQRHTRILANMGTDDSVLPFAQAQNYLSGEHHYNAFNAIPMRPRTGNPKNFFSHDELHPLVAGSDYARDLGRMRNAISSTGSAIGAVDIGTVARSRVGHLRGQGAEFFWSRVAGDSGALMTSRRMQRIGAQATDLYKVAISGPVGDARHINPTTSLGSWADDARVQDFLADRTAKVLQLGGSPIETNSAILASFTSGKKIKGVNVVGRNVKDKIYEIQKTSEGIRLMMQDTRPVVQQGIALTVGGVRASGGRGPMLGGMDLLVQGLKGGDPRVAREQYASHYAQKVMNIRGIGANRKAEALSAYAEYAGLGVSSFTTAGGQSRAVLNTSKGMGNFADGAFMTDAWRQGLAEHMSKRLGLKKAVSGKYFATKRRDFTTDELVGMLRGGGMNKADARTFASRHGKGLYADIFEATNVKFRASNVIEESARVRMGEARMLLSKVTDFAGGGGPGSELAAKFAGVLSGNIGKTEDFVKSMIVAQNAALYGPDAVQAVAQKYGIGIMKHADVANQGLLSEIQQMMSETGTLTPEMYDKFTSQFGMNKDSLGTFVDVSGTHLGNIDVLAGSRGKGAASALANHIFVPNIGRVAPEFHRASTTGAVGDVTVIPRRATAAGAKRSKVRALGVISNVFNFMEQMLDPTASKGAMTKRMAMSNMAITEALVGNKAIIGHKEVSGIVGGRFTIRQMSTKHNVAAVSLTESGIKRAYKGDVGLEMLRKLKRGEDVFGIYKRDPVQSAAQLVPVKINLMRGSQVGTSDTMWTSRVLDALSQADHDFDHANMYVPSLEKGGMTFGESQRMLSAMHAADAKGVALLGRMMDTKMMGAVEDLSGAASPTGKIDEMLASMGLDVNDSATMTKKQADAYRAALGSFQRDIQPGGSVGTLHNFALRQSRALEAVSGVTTHFNVTNMGMLKKKYNLQGARVAQNADYVRFIYGFLKKGTQFTDDTLAGVSSLLKAPGMAHGTKAWNAASADLAKRLASMSRGMPDTGMSFFAAARTSGMSAAQQAVARNMGEIPADSPMWRNMADDMMGVAAIEQQIRGNKTTSALMSEGAVGGNYAEQLMREITGLSVSAPGMTQGGAEIMGELTEQGYVLNEKVANMTIDAAATGIEDVINKTAAFADDFGSSKGWGMMKVAMGVAAGIGVASALSSSPEQDRPPMQVNNVSPGPGMPPTPMVNYPTDGARPSAVAIPNAGARINRVRGQRRHFGGEQSVFMPQGFNIMDSIQGSPPPGGGLGEIQSQPPTDSNWNF